MLEGKEQEREKVGVCVTSSIVRNILKRSMHSTYTIEAEKQRPTILYNTHVAEKGLYK